MVPYTRSQVCKRCTYHLCCCVAIAQMGVGVFSLQPSLETAACAGYGQASALPDTHLEAGQHGGNVAAHNVAPCEQFECAPASGQARQLQLGPQLRITSYNMRRQQWLDAQRMQRLIGPCAR